MTFDPNAAAQPGSGIFGLPHTRKQAGIVLIPMPFDATTSYGGGTAQGPEAVFNASMQVDLYDHQFGRTYERGIFMEPISARFTSLSRQARALARPIIEKGGAASRDKAAVARVNAACEAVNRHTHLEAVKILKEGKIAGLIGGDHSTPFGFIRACAEHAAGLKGNKGLGILQIDAHMDFRDAFEGFTWSHASIMFNVLTRIPEVSRLVQVGARDYGEGELDFGRSRKGRAHTHFDFDWARRLDAGEVWEDLCKQAIKPLPKHVYISFDIDGLDPALCPHTGTPVAGGLSFNRACVLLELLARSGRTIVGFDLNEVSPGLKPNPNEPEWDANVGARVLYKLCGAAAAANS
ncbi:MAG: agmatinase family protein [Phycisphaerales bacterium]|nr:agmatinase family protein [Phycisphaerales bacterium]